MKVNINGQEIEIDETVSPKIFYEEIARLVGVANPTITCCVRTRSRCRLAQSVLPGESIPLVPHLIITATRTDNA